MVTTPKKSNSANRRCGLVLLAIAISCLGCRSLGSGRQTRELSAARQRSLRGADELQQRNYDEAESLFRDALKRSSADERAQWGMAEVLWQRDQRIAALKHMQQATEISGDNPDLLVRLGAMHLEEGQLDEALSNADRAIKGDRKNAKAWELRGTVLRRQNNLEEAMQCYHRALICQPNSPSVQVELAEVYRDLNRPQRALATLDRMVDAQRGGEIAARAWMLRGQSLLALGLSKEAQLCLKHAAECADDTESLLLLELAQAQLESGELAEARLCLGRALRNDPQNPNALAIQAEVDRRFDQRTADPLVPILRAGYEVESRGLQ